MSDNELLFVSVFNYGVIDLALNHLESLRKQNIKNYMAFVTDLESVYVLKIKGHPVSFIEDESVNKEANSFDSPKFNSISFLRYKVIKQLIQNGMNVWYMDVDTVVLKDLRNIYNQVKNKNIDAFFQNDINMPCSGCVLYFANPKTYAFVNSVEHNKTEKYGDQIIVREFIKSHSSKPEFIKFATLNESMFPNGLLYFGDNEFGVQTPEMFKAIKSEYENMQNKDIYFVHANWMVGKDTKQNALKKYGLWFI